MERIYFDARYRWVNQEHEEGETRAFCLFRDGQVKVGRRTIGIDRRAIEMMLENQLIEEVI